MKKVKKYGKSWKWKAGENKITPIQASCMSANQSFAWGSYCPPFEAHLTTGAQTELDGSLKGAHLLPGVQVFLPSIFRVPWNPKIPKSSGRIIFQTPCLKFHVKFRGSSCGHQKHPVHYTHDTSWQQQCPHDISCLKRLNGYQWCNPIYPFCIMNHASLLSSLSRSLLGFLL